MHDKDQKLIWESYSDKKKIPVSKPKFTSKEIAALMGMDKETPKPTNITVKKEENTRPSGWEDQGYEELDYDNMPDDERDQLTPDEKQLITKEKDDDGKERLISQLKQLNELIPQDATIQWSIADGTFGSLTPERVLGPEPENQTLKALINVLNKIWSDDEYAAKLGLANADWSGEDNSSGSIFWTANDTHYHDVYGKGYTDQFQNIKPEHKEQYDRFFRDKRLADNYVSKLVGGRPVNNKGLEEVTSETFKDQKHWRISLSPKSEEITSRGQATSDAVGYGKGRYMGD